jgi:hypothetical protein
MTRSNALFPHERSTSSVDHRRYRGRIMPHRLAHLIRLCVAQDIEAVGLLVSRSATAQGWIEYTGETTRITKTSGLLREFSFLLRACKKTHLSL